MNRIPQSLGAKQKVGVPLGAVIQPLADPPPGAQQIKVVQPISGDGANAPRSASGNTVLGSIVRCKKCRTYINPYVNWEYNGRRWKCNLCDFVNDTGNV